MSRMNITERLTRIGRGEHLDLVDLVCGDAVTEIQRLRTVLLNIQSLAERGFPIDHMKLATRCRLALGGQDCGWLPIETAPKDGTVILVWDKCFKDAAVAHYKGKCWWVNNTYGFCEDGEIPSIDITHWMPLPTPPKE